MKTVILCGGLGTRISEESHLKPKPMIEVGGRPILWHIMKLYSSYGFNDFVICLGYRGYVIKEYFANYVLHNADLTIDLANGSTEYHAHNHEPWKVTLVETGAETMTGGRLKRVEKYLTPGEPFFFTYGDGVADLDMGKLAAFHKAHGRDATLTAVAPPGRYGSLEMDGARVERFTEKPPGDNALINGGFFVLNLAVIARIEGDATVWEREPLEGLAADDQLQAYRHDGFWAAMDTLRDKNHLEALWASGEAPVAAVNASFWAGKRVLLTGHTGFKGSWAAIWLTRMGAEVTGLSLAPDTEPNLFGLAGVGARTDSRIADLRDAAAVEVALAGRAFDLVLHMAAQPIVRTSVEDPIGTFATNVMGTVHLLQALRGQVGLQAVLVITSDKVYANNETGRAFAEGDNLGGKDPYSASKAAAEIVVQSYAKSYFQHVAVGTARGGNVIGGGDFSKDRIVADIVRAARAGEAVVLRHPEATRPWQHVLDCLAGYFVLAERLARDPATPRAVNFGPKPGGAEVSVGELATLGVEALGGQPWRHEPDPRSLEARSLAIDATLARIVLGFESRLDAPRAVALTMDWYRRQAAGEDALSLCLEQIEGYESAA